MPLSDIVQNKVISCTLGTPIHEVADLMKSHDVGAVLVTDGDKPVGICTDRDIVLRCVCEDLPLDTTVDKIMTKHVDTVGIDEGLQDVIRHMRDKEIRRVCVVDTNGRAVGLISFGDIVGLLAKELSDLSATTPVDVAA